MLLKFNPHQFNKLFPFYLVLDKQLQIKACGNSIEKLCHVQVGNRFENYFSIIRPEILRLNFSELKRLEQQLFVFETVNLVKEKM
jgi:hypothetical protein